MDYEPHVYIPFHVLPSGVEPLQSNELSFNYKKNNFELFGDTENHYRFAFTADGITLNINDKNASMHSKYLSYDTNTLCTCTLKFDIDTFKIAARLGQKAAQLYIQKTYPNLVSSWNLGFGDRFVEYSISRKNPDINFGYYYSVNAKSFHFSVEDPKIKYAIQILFPKLTIGITHPSYTYLKLRTRRGNATVGLTTRQQLNQIFAFARFSHHWENSKIFWCYEAAKGLSAGFYRDFMEKRLKAKIFTTSNNVIANTEYKINDNFITTATVGTDIKKFNFNFNFGITMLDDN